MGTRVDRRRGTAGRTATAGYERARRHVRHRRREVAGWLVAATVAAVVAGRSISGRPWSAGAWSGWGLRCGTAAVVVALALAIVRRPPADPERWLRGAAGELATAARLDQLGGRRWIVLHDRWLPGGRANVDHLVIGRRGVWVLDSKAFRAPVRTGWRHVRVGDRRLEVSAVAWEASVVADHLGVEVRPLVVIHGVLEHGGRLPTRGRRCDGVRVLRADAVVRHLRRARRGRRLRRGEMEELARRASALLPPA